ncbi:iron-sulfur cluster assembly protein [Moheibacter stercoris]|uniref:FeS assembly SUF system protein n=1 Tax=Moheibacter stercoris TaxID=1628251 RepID=A0ABV2LV97_9FLAO
MALSEKDLENMGEMMVQKFKTIYDPEIPVDIYELGLIYDAFVNAEGQAKVLMTLTSPNCPVAESLPNEVRTKVEEIEGITEAEVEITFDPPWDRDMMSEEAKFELGML